MGDSDCDCVEVNDWLTVDDNDTLAVTEGDDDRLSEVVAVAVTVAVADGLAWYDSDAVGD